MKVNIKCLSSLSGSEECVFNNSKALEIEAGQTVGDIAGSIGISPEDIHLVFVNSRHADLQTRLEDGDAVTLAPAVGGM